ncbi:MAG: hypothetical protein H0Z18_05325 [Thermococcus sp.]|uniref:hypothetical protein n=1 Tax=Thermococcus sp. TaxID=35749 RepID=UPI001D521ABE|nr:hypothetical protein [Thermococcus sp.]MBO8174660.1 hypothetical protein [Thermococcus sp.]
MLRKLLSLMLGLFVLGAIGGIVSATEKISPTYIDPGSGGGTVVYLGVDQKLTYAEYGKSGVEDHNGVFHVNKNQYYLGSSQKVSTWIETAGYGYVITYVAVGEKFDIGGTGSAYAAIDVPIRINGWIDVGFGDASYKVDVCIRDLTTGALTCFNVDGQEFHQTGNKPIDKQILYRTPAYIFKSGHRYVVYVKLTSKVYSNGGFSATSLSLDVKYDYIYIDFA